MTSPAPTPFGFVTASTLRFWAVLYVGLCLFVARIDAATFTWDGGGADNNVTTAQNWVGDIAPAANSDIIWAGTTRLSVNIDIGGPGRTFTFDNTAGAFVISGAAISMSHGFFNYSANLQTLNLGITLTAAQTIDAATASFVFGGASLINGGHLLTIAGGYGTTITNVISGAGGLTRSGSGTLTLSGANTYTGVTSVNGGVLVLNHATALSGGIGSTGGTSALTINGGVIGLGAGNFNRALGTGSSQVRFTGSGGFAAYGADRTVNLGGSGTPSQVTWGSGNFVPTDSVLILGATGADKTVTFQNPIAFGNAARTVQVNNGSAPVDAVLGGVLSGAGGGLTKTGAGTLTLSATNTYSGGTIISGGTLIAAGTTGSALGGTNSITVNNGGTLLLGASNQINNSAGMTLAGGTFAKGNFSEGATNAVGLGALTLTAASTIDFGTGTVGTLTFASLTPGLHTLTIANWTGLPNTVGSATTDRLIFNASQAANLSSFAFTGYTGATQFDLGNGFYEIAPIAPVPEPATCVAGALTFLTLAYQQRSRLSALRRRRGLRKLAA